jgi:hypothetical protein
MLTISASEPVSLLVKPDVAAKQLEAEHVPEEDCEWRMTQIT